ncbi:hypothetical protein BDF20DRAFT_890630 [Mycotypha africana]|uniref:uncharacterized protein n=1 Tax=Mycotypha africana TaxID=64632 RepID=UPI002301874A|nr:uncharacterized protein BDF20DRAFT_890630 [Mycotypha africana]KAI8970330.1 hypothetical protein BDF20DRAFT_890630 [Mycotypha africana]
MQRFSPSSNHPSPSVLAVDSAITNNNNNNTETSSNHIEITRRLPLPSWVLRRPPWRLKRDDKYMMLTDDHTTQYQSYLFYDEVEMLTSSIAEYNRFGVPETQIEGGNSEQKSSNTAFGCTENNTNSLHIQTQQQRREGSRIRTHRRLPGSVINSNKPPSTQEKQIIPKCPLSNTTSSPLKRSYTCQIPSLEINHRSQRGTSTAAATASYARIQYLTNNSCQGFPDRRTSRNYHQDPLIQARLNELLQNEKVQQISKLINEKKLNRHSSKYIWSSKGCK